MLESYVAQLARADLTAQARRTYTSRVRVYLAWLADHAAGDVDGDPLGDRAAAVWAARDYKTALHASRRAPATVNGALAAVSDLAVRRGLGALDGTAVARLDLPARRAPRALTGRDDTRWQRAAETAPPRDRALVGVLRLAGARLAEAVALDLDDLPTTQRRRRLRLRGKGRRDHAVPVHPELGAALDAWLAERRFWPGAPSTPAVFLNRAGGRLSARAADTVVAAVARAAALEDLVTPHVLRHSFATDLVRAGVDLVPSPSSSARPAWTPPAPTPCPPTPTSTPPSPGSPSTADPRTRRPGPRHVGRRGRARPAPADGSGHAVLSTEPLRQPVLQLGMPELPHRARRPQHLPLVRPHQQLHRPPRTTRPPRHPHPRTRTEPEHEPAREPAREPGCHPKREPDLEPAREAEGDSAREPERDRGRDPGRAITSMKFQRPKDVPFGRGGRPTAGRPRTRPRP